MAVLGGGNSTCGGPLFSSENGRRVPALQEISGEFGAVDAPLNLAAPLFRVTECGS